MGGTLAARMTGAVKNSTERTGKTIHTGPRPGIRSTRAIIKIAPGVIARNMQPR